MSTAKNAILKAKVEGIIYEIMAKTGAANVYVDDSTTLATKLSEIVADINGKATASHTHAQSEVTGLEDALTARPTTNAMNTAISTAISDLIGGAPETYDTLKEIADYIAAHEDVVTALNAAIGAKLSTEDFNTWKATLGSLAYKSKVAEDALDDALKAKVNTAHSHANKALLDTYTQTESDLADAVTKKHAHANKTVLDGITADKVSAWDGKSRVLFSITEPADLTEQDLWIHIQ